MTTAEALTAALVAEHVAVYCCGIAGAQLSGGEQERARAAYDAHRARRDRLVALLLDRGAPAPAAAPAYALPPVRTAPAARRLLARLENALAVRYADLVAAAGTGDVRAFAAAALQDCAVRAAQWGEPGGAFPGLPERAAAPTPPLPGPPTSPPTTSAHPS